MPANTAGTVTFDAGNFRRRPIYKTIRIFHAESEFEVRMDVAPSVSALLHHHGVSSTNTAHLRERARERRAERGRQLSRRNLRARQQKAR